MNNDLPELQPGETLVRASSLTQYPNCGLKWGTEQLTGEFSALGYEIRQEPRGIGAMVGTGTHSAIAHALIAKMESGELGDAREAVDFGIADLESQTSEGSVLWDDTTPSLSDGQIQVAKQTQTYLTNVGPNITPIAVEERLNARYHGGLVISGQQDTIIIDPVTLADVKTGRNHEVHLPQLGCYSLLLRSHGAPVEKIEEHYIPRVPIKIDQPVPIITEYNVEVAERAAKSVLDHLVHDIAVFRETNSPDAFIANPHSKLCTEKWCPAHGTNLCRHHKGAK